MNVIKVKQNGQWIPASGSGVAVDATLTPESENPVQSKVMQAALAQKQATLVSGTNIKTINNNSILGSGNISIEAGAKVIEYLSNDLATTMTQVLAAIENDESVVLYKESEDTDYYYYLTYHASDTYQFICESYDDTGITASLLTIYKNNNTWYSILRYNLVNGIYSNFYFDYSTHGSISDAKLFQSIAEVAYTSQYLSKAVSVTLNGQLSDSSMGKNNTALLIKSNLVSQSSEFTGTLTFAGFGLQVGSSYTVPRMNYITFTYDGSTTSVSWDSPMHPLIIKYTTAEAAWLKINEVYDSDLPIGLYTSENGEIIWIQEYNTSTSGNPATYTYVGTGFSDTTYLIKTIKLVKTVTTVEGVSTTSYSLSVLDSNSLRRTSLPRVIPYERSSSPEDTIKLICQYLYYDAPNLTIQYSNILLPLAYYSTSGLTETGCEEGEFQFIGRANVESQFLQVEYTFTYDGTTYSADRSFIPIIEYIEFDEDDLEGTLYRGINSILTIYNYEPEEGEEEGEFYYHPQGYYKEDTSSDDTTGYKMTAVWKRSYNRTISGTNHVYNEFINIIDTYTRNTSTGVSSHTYSFAKPTIELQPKLESGTSLKTINNYSLLGSGNIDVSGGGGSSASYIIIDYSSAGATAWSRITEALTNNVTVFVSRTGSTTTGSWQRLYELTEIQKDTNGDATAYVFDSALGAINRSTSDFVQLYLHKNGLWESFNRGLEITTNKVTAWSTDLSDSNYPSEKLVKESLDDLEEELDNKVSVSTSGSSTTEVKYITIDGVEHKLAGGSTVSASETGTSTNLANYLTINGTQYKIGGSGSGGVITGTGAPTSETVGTVGSIYLDTNTNRLYRCQKIVGEVYYWTTDINTLMIPTRGSSTEAVSVAQQILPYEYTYPAMASNDIGNIGTVNLIYSEGTAIESMPIVIPMITHAFNEDEDTFSIYFAGIYPTMEDEATVSTLDMISLLLQGTYDASTKTVLSATWTKEFIQYKSFNGTIITSWDSGITDVNVPSAKLTHDLISEFRDEVSELSDTLDETLETVNDLLETLVNGG